MNLKNRITGRRFAGPQLLQLAMPLGGLGAGCVCLNGYGGLQDFAIRHRPDFSALPDGHHTLDAAFALLHIKGEQPVTKLIEGPLPVEKIYDQGLKAQGYRQGGHEGLPRFESARFEAQYPFGRVQLRDENIPLDVEITGWNPFIPLDDKSSGLPCAILEYSFTNRSAARVVFEFSYHLSHLADSGQKGNARNEIINDKTGRGVFFGNNAAPHSEAFGSAALLMPGYAPQVKAMWFRGGWFDSLSALWREVSTGQFQANDGSDAAQYEGRNGGSLLIGAALPPGKSITFPVVIAWHFPNVNQRSGEDANCGGACDCASENAPAWRPFYAGQWPDARAVALHVAENLEDLRSRTAAFSEALFSSTLPPFVLDAIASNLAILKSPTLLRQENGNVWAWEGCFTQSGCCSGSCTHVWNYAQALPHLFPALERTLREQELLRSQDENGHVQFRAALPDGPAPHEFHAAADGQLGGIMKLWRDYQIGGDRTWLASLFPHAKRSLDYCIATWDPQREGALCEPHHNTYDIEFWGPDGMCGSIYVGALCAMVSICRELGEAGDEYADLAGRAARYLDERLFNGEYYQQNVQWQGLRDTSFAARMAQVDENSSAMLRLQKAEGPKYQYGSGCLSDGVIGAWMAQIYGIETPLDAGHIRSTLRAIYKHNFKRDLFEHACLQRPGYAMGHEPGLLLCTWPRGGKPTLPFVYSDEVWTGIEYQVASHLIESGLVDEGLTIVQAVRSRYEGHVRNPFNEYECGSYYARALASYALLASLAGFRYSAATKILHFAPRLAALPFQTFFSTATGFGTIELTADALTITMLEGELALSKVVLTRSGATQNIEVHRTAHVGAPVVIALNKQNTKNTKET